MFTALAAYGLYIAVVTHTDITVPDGCVFTQSVSWCKTGPFWQICEHPTDIELTCRHVKTRN